MKKDRNYWNSIFREIDETWAGIGEPEQETPSTNITEPTGWLSVRSAADWEHDQGAKLLDSFPDRHNSDARLRAFFFLAYLYGIVRIDRSGVSGTFRLYAYEGEDRPNWGLLAYFCKRVSEDLDIIFGDGYVNPRPRVDWRFFEDIFSVHLYGKKTPLRQYMQLFGKTSPATRSKKTEVIDTFFATWKSFIEGLTAKGLISSWHEKKYI